MSMIKVTVQSAVLVMCVLWSKVKCISIALFLGCFCVAEQW